MGGHGTIAEAIPPTNSWVAGLKAKYLKKEINQLFLFPDFLHTQTGRISIKKPIRINVIPKITEPK
ncbi:hypothetical protein JCM12298_20430 [Desulfothermus naphthae]